MPVPAPKQRAAGRISAANRSISPPLHRSSTCSSRSSTPTGMRKNRSSATNGERIQLRRWWADKSFGKREQKDEIAWSEAQFDRVLSSSTISDYLGPKFAHLYTTELSKYEITLSRSSTAEYEELEETLAEWQCQYDRHPDSG